MGGCRITEDYERVNKLKDLCKKLGIVDNVIFKLNVPFSEILSMLETSSVGLHSMWNEHFGICVVEMMAAVFICKNFVK